MPLSSELFRQDHHLAALSTARPSPMKVAFVSETWRPEINGVTHTLSQLAQALYDRQYPLQLIRPATVDGAREALVSHELQVKAIPVKDYDGVNIGWVSPRGLREFWLADRPDVVYIATEGPLGMVALRVARQLHLPVVSGFHTNFDQYSRYYLWLRAVRPFVGAFLKRFHNRTQATLVPTQKQADHMTALGYKNIQVMGRGLDHGRFSTAHRDETLRASWGAGHDTPVALYIGRLAIEKNIPLLIASLKALRERHPDQIAVIVGDGPMRHDIEQALPWATFVGFQKNEALARYYASADLFLFPSLSETFGNVVTEAMASGLCVVAFDRAAAGELIDNGVDGCVVPCDNEEAFICAAVKVRETPQNITAMGKRACTRVASLTWPHIADTFIRHLHQAMETHDA